MDQTVLNAINTAIANQSNNLCSIPRNQYNYLIARIDDRITTNVAPANIGVRRTLLWFRGVIIDWYIEDTQQMKLKHVQILKVLMTWLAA